MSHTIDDATTTDAAWNEERGPGVPHSPDGWSAMASGLYETPACSPPLWSPLPQFSGQLRLGTRPGRAGRRPPGDGGR